jgi:hypothetical protein
LGETARRCCEAQLNPPDPSATFDTKTVSIEEIECGERADLEADAREAGRRLGWGETLIADVALRIADGGVVVATLYRGDDLLVHLAFADGISEVLVAHGELQEAARSSADMEVEVAVRLAPECHALATRSIADAGPGRPRRRAVRPGVDLPLAVRRRPGLQRRMARKITRPSPR